MYTLLKETPLGRRGILHTAYGDVQTPFFLPVATAGAMKGLTHDDLLTLGAEILLCNTYHLHLQPGEKIIQDAGGLHDFMNWHKPVLTDSGGFQVFSLRGISTITNEGVHFRSHINGDPLFLGPEESMRIQHAIGADVIMCFDQCPPSTAPREEQEEAVSRTLEWARACVQWHEKFSSERESEFNLRRPLLFGIVQGGLHRDLREHCAEELIAMNFDGYAVGGLAVGESEDEMYGVLDVVCPMLPKDKLRYLMGVGKVSQQQHAIAKGIDMFDSVLPMREARHGKLYLSDGSDLRITNAAFLEDHTVVDPHSPSPLSRKHLKSFLCHLFRAKERLSETIACMQNLGITLHAMKKLQDEMDELI